MRSPVDPGPPLLTPACPPACGASHAPPPFPAAAAPQVDFGDSFNRLANLGAKFDKDAYLYPLKLKARPALPPATPCRAACCGGEHTGRAACQRACCLPSSQMRAWRSRWVCAPPWVQVPARL